MTATAANDNQPIPQKYASDLTDPAERRAWLESLPPLPAPRKSRNKGGHPDLARPCLLWWRSVMSFASDGSSWPDGSRDNDNEDPATRSVERPWSVRDHNPKPKHTAEALMAALPVPRRVSVTRTPGGQMLFRYQWLDEDHVKHRGRTARLGGLEFTTESGKAVQYVDGVGARRFRVWIGTLLRVNGDPLKADIARPRESRSAGAIAADKASAAWFGSSLDAGALPVGPVPRKLFVGMTVAAKSSPESGVQSQVDRVDTVEDVLVSRQQMEVFRDSYPLESSVLDAAMTAQRFADLAANDNPATGRRLLKRSVQALETFLAA